MKGGRERKSPVMLSTGNNRGDGSILSRKPNTNDDGFSKIHKGWSHGKAECQTLKFERSAHHQKAMEFSTVVGYIYSIAKMWIVGTD
jgi:hypothetical protein